MYRFGPFLIDPRERLLRRGDVVLPLTPKAVDTLLALVEARGRLVEKDELMNRLWPGTFVEEANLTNQISLLRKAMGDDAAYIETVPKRGYRFVGPVSDAGISIAPRRRVVVPLLVASFLLTAAIAAVWWQARRDRSPERVPLKIARLTTSGQIRHAVISADGRYVAYAALDGDGESLWIRHVASTSRVEVVPTAPVTYLGLTFGPDTNSIYYVVRERSRPREGALYRVAVLGGASPPRLILTDIDTPVAFSPDGNRMAYVVSNQLTGQSALMIAGAEGAGAAMLAARHSPEEFTWAGAGPVWTPAGASVITAGVSTDGNGAYGSLIEVQTSDGSQKPLGSRRFSEVGRIAWERNGSGFIVAASERLGANQLWRVSYPSGDARQITNDESKNYLGVSLTADGSVLATVQRDAQASVWLADDGDATRARQITEGKYDGRHGLAWTPDGRIVYHSLESGNEDIWIINADGSGRRQLTVDPGVDERPSVSPDGRHIVFASNRLGGFTIWRMDAGGGNERQLTHGHGDGSPVVTPDGRWVVYSSSTSGRPTLWKVPVDGGEAAQVTTLASMDPVISPDGTLVAFRYRDDPNTDGRLAVLRLSDGALVKAFPPPPDGLAAQPRQWTADGITYGKASGGASNIWSQPLAGGPPRQLTRFTSERIIRYAWSRDGRSLIYAQGAVNNDVVLISGAR